MAGSAFKDPAVVKAMQHFTPILVDGDTEKEVVSKYGVRGYPNTVFATVKGEKVATVTGAVPVASFLSSVESAAKKAKQGKGSKQYQALVKADEALTKALEKDNVKAALAAIEKADEAKLEHPLHDRAVAVRAELMARGEKALAEARKDLEAGEADKARKVLRELNLDYKGTTVGDAAKDLLAKMKADEEK